MIVDTELGGRQGDLRREIPIDHWYPDVSSSPGQDGEGRESVPLVDPVSLSHSGADLFGVARTGPSSSADLFAPYERRRVQSRHRVRRPAMAATVAMLTVVAGVVAIVATDFDDGDNHTAIASVSAPLSVAEAAGRSSLPPAPVPDPCAGLHGVVTTQVGGRDTPLHVVAALQYAYYVKHDARAAIGLYAPGVLSPPAVDAVHSFVMHIPAGTRYCVGARMIGPTSVDYDVHELRPSTTAAGTGVVSTPVTYRMTLSVTARAPYLIERLAARE